MRIGFVIPCYNSRSLLEKYFHTIYEIAGEHSAEIVIVDDASSDGSTEFISDNFGKVIIHNNEINLGFVKTVNKGVRLSSADIICLLNTDIEAKSDFLTPALNHFEDNNVFSVSFKSLNSDGSFREGAKRVVFRGGYFKVLHNIKDQYPLVDGIQYTDYPVGGHCLLRKSMFEELNGLDEIYSPFYWEDTDIGLRARKKGWKNIYDPASEIYHHHRGAIKTYYDDLQIKTIKIRNRIIFTRKHAASPELVVHKAFTAIRLVGSFFTGDKAFRNALNSAGKISLEK